jgi:hypothetical protein
MAQAEHRYITRRCVITAIPIAAAASFPAAADTASDPIFSAMAAHARAYADVMALLAAQDAADSALRRADAAAQPALEAQLHALCEAEGPLGLLEMQAAERLIHTVPGTLAGAAALLRYVRELFERDGYTPCEEDGYLALLASAEYAICREIGLAVPR